jgi:hypothetical protein
MLFIDAQKVKATAKLYNVCEHSTAPREDKILVLDEGELFGTVIRGLVGLEKVPLMRVEEEVLVG